MSIQVGGLRFSYSGALSNIAFLGVTSNADSLHHHESINTWASSQEKNALLIKETTVGGGTNTYLDEPSYNTTTTDNLYKNNLSYPDKSTIL